MRQAFVLSSLLFTFQPSYTSSLTQNHHVCGTGHDSQLWPWRITQHVRSTPGSQQNHFKKNNKASLTLSSDDTPSGFLKLPFEIRKMIYYLTLVTGSVEIKDLHPHEWQVKKEAGHALRTSYEKTRDHPKIFSHRWGGARNSEQWGNAEVSYTLSRRTEPPCITMLALNRQTRAEAIPIFYKKNEINFSSMSAILPFLRDRSELSLQSMQHFRVNIKVDRCKMKTDCRKRWARIFSELPNFGLRNLEKFTISILGCKSRFDHEQLKVGTNLQLWVHDLAGSITNLDMLGISMFSMDKMVPDRMVQELLWEFLAPKMLKRIGDEPHDAKSLLKRRIR